MTSTLTVLALPLAILLQSKSSETYYYVEESPLAALVEGIIERPSASELDEQDKVAKSVADHIAAQSKCPYYKFDQLTWQTNESTWPTYFQQLTASVEPGSETWLLQRRFAERRLSWLSKKEIGASRYASHKEPLAAFNDQMGKSAYEELQNFCSHMAKSPANILVEIRE